MINFQRLPRITLYCYVISIMLIGFVLVEQTWQILLVSQKSKITILITAAIIGVAGSVVSISKQIISHLKK